MFEVVLKTLAGIDLQLTLPLSAIRHQSVYSLAKNLAKANETTEVKVWYEGKLVVSVKGEVAACAY